MNATVKYLVTGAVAVLAAKHGASFVAPYTASVLGKYNDEVVGALVGGAAVLLLHKVL